MAKNNTAHSHYIADPSENNTMVEITGLYWIEQTPVGPVIIRAISYDDAVKDNDQFLSIRKEAITFDEAKTFVKNWYLQKAMCFEIMEEQDFDKMVSDLENNKTEVLSMRKMIEDIEEGKGKTKKKDFLKSELRDDNEEEPSQIDKVNNDLKEIVDDGQLN